MMNELAFVSGGEGDCGPGEGCGPGGPGEGGGGWGGDPSGVCSVTGVNSDGSVNCSLGAVSVTGMSLGSLGSGLSIGDAAALGGLLGGGAAFASWLAGGTFAAVSFEGAIAIGTLMGGGIAVLAVVIVAGGIAVLNLEVFNEVPGGP